MERYDKIIIGAGFYGLYAALFCAKRGQSVSVLECDPAPFMRATYINQARVHQGYHYPRSISTAMKSKGYFERFIKDYSFCIGRGFQQVYAISSRYSWTDPGQFRRFCRAVDIPCEELHVHDGDRSVYGGIFCRGLSLPGSGRRLDDHSVVPIRCLFWVVRDADHHHPLSPDTDRAGVQTQEV